MIRKCKCGKDYELGKHKKRYMCLECYRTYKREWEKTNRARPDYKKRDYSKYKQKLAPEVLEGNKLKRRTRWMSRAALANGLIIKTPCVQCGNPESEIHHPDYYKPLEVVWLCRIHHKQLHNQSITHCSKGHEYSKENTYIYNNERRCKKCNGDRSKNYRNKKAEGK